MTIFVVLRAFFGIERHPTRGQSTKESVMTGHIKVLSQRARLREFVFSDSGAMSSKKAAQLGMAFMASSLAAFLMAPSTAHADPCGLVPCENGQWQCDAVYGTGAGWVPCNWYRPQCAPGGWNCGHFCTWDDRC